MELQQAKYVSMIVLFLPNLFVTLVGIYVEKYLRQRNAHVLSIIQRIISCLTSGILFGTLLMLILPTSLGLIAEQWHHQNQLGYLMIGLGFFLTCLIEEITRYFERRESNNAEKIEAEQLIDTPSNEKQLTHLIALVFALGVHYFFEGILIGGQTKDTATLWILLAAVTLHMALVAFSVTLRLLINHEKSIRVFLTMLSWSLMGPLGVLISLLISSTTSTELNSINGMLQCLSAGTFIYVTLISMLHDDLIKTKKYPFFNIILIFLGFLIVVFTSYGHQH